MTNLYRYLILTLFLSACGPPEDTTSSHTLGDISCSYLDGGVDDGEMPQTAKVPRLDTPGSPK